MEKSILLLLFFSVLLGVSGYYIGFVKPPKTFAWLAKATFFCSLVLIPILCLVLWFQSGAKERLSNTGFVPHPNIEEPIGIAFGIGKNPIWIFKTDDDKNSVFNFYNESASRPGWELTSNEGSYLLFKQGNKEMTVGHQEGWISNSIVFMLNNNIK